MNEERIPAELELVNYGVSILGQAQRVGLAKDGVHPLGLVVQLADLVESARADARREVAEAIEAWQLYIAGLPAERKPGTAEDQRHWSHGMSMAHTIALAPEEWTARIAAQRAEDER